MRPSHSSAGRRPGPVAPRTRPVPPAPRRVRPGRPPGVTLGYLGAALGYLLALGLTCLVFVWTPAGQYLDGELLPRTERGGGYEQQTVLVEPAKEVLARFGNPVLLAILLISVLVLAVVGGRGRAGVAGVAVVLGSAAVAGATKGVVPRPDLGIGTSTTHNSFPSGHVTVAMALLLALILVLPGRVRWWFAVPGAAGVSLVAAATMIAGWHRFSDTVGGVLLATALFCVAAAGLSRWGGVPGGAAGSRGGLVVVAVGSVALLGGLLGFVTASAAPIGTGLFVAIAAEGGITVLVVGSVLFLVRPLGPGPAAARSAAGPAGRPAGSDRSPDRVPPDSRDIGMFRG